jgi:preprotein translocase subunit SecE
VVYRGGLENRFGLTPDGGSNPSLSAKPDDAVEVKVVSTLQYILLGVAVAVFFWAWQKGHLLRLGNYVDETKVELRKCTWPTREELKGSTVVVLVSTALVAVFTVGVDFIISQMIVLLNNNF